MKYPTLSATLKTNAAFSAIGGALLLAPAVLADLMGTIPVWLCQAVGLGLLIFAADVLWVALRLPRSQRFVSWIFAADVAWVLATPVVMLAFAAQLSIWAQLILLDVALVVGVFAFLEWRGIRREGVFAGAER
jgi:multisubunit Na+/H+ antiporter MnhF subunit